MNIWVNRESGLIEQYGNAEGLSDNVYEVVADVSFPFLKGHNYAYVNGTIVILPTKPSPLHEYINGGWVEVPLILPFYEKRINEYPPIADQLDMLFHAMDVGEIPKATAWYNTIKGIKTKHPKG